MDVLGEYFVTSATSEFGKGGLTQYLCLACVKFDRSLTELEVFNYFSESYLDQGLIGGLARRSVSLRQL